MKTLKFGMLLLASIAAMAHAQSLRESICVVKPEYSVEEQAKFGDFALWLSRKGFFSDSRMLSAYKNGVTGSGVVLNVDGKQYIITNRHVIGYAHEATISFVLRDTTILWEHCGVLTTDQSTDLAIIGLPTTCTQPALPLSTMELEDGMDIIAAGFPGLNGQPSWQLTNGVVSNGYLQINEAKHPFIQHTAAIDPGSSGGPLLAKTDVGYQIIGINTMKAWERENVGLAIPAATLQAFVDKISTPTLPDYRLLKNLTINGETWSKMLDMMDKACLDSLKKMSTELPLDVVYNTINLKCTPELKTIASKSSKKESSSKEKERSSSIYDSGFGNYLWVRAEYSNAFGMNQHVNLVWEGNRQLFVYGIDLSLVLDEILPPSDESSHLSPNFGLGIRFGIQVPLHMGKNYAIPRFIVSPCITPTGFINSATYSSSLMGYVPFLIGNDFAFSVGDHLLSIGVHYVYDISLYNENTYLVMNNNHKLLNKGDMVNLIGKSSLSVSLSFGW